MNLCRDCKHEETSWISTNRREFSKCKLTVSPISGFARSYCETQRLSSGSCGHEGRNFEQKKTFWARLTGK